MEQVNWRGGGGFQNEEGGAGGGVALLTGNRARTYIYFTKMGFALLIIVKKKKPIRYQVIILYCPSNIFGTKTKEGRGRCRHPAWPPMKCMHFPHKANVVH